MTRNSTYSDLQKRYRLERLEYNINISLKYHYMYFNMPKSACSTIKRRLFVSEISGLPQTYNLKKYALHDRVRTPLISPFQLSEDLIECVLTGGKFSRFTFVKNPFTRVLSAYLNKIQTNQPQKKGILLALNREVTDLATPVSFEEFLFAVKKIPKYRRDGHWAVQYDHCCADLLKYDFIGRVEQFEDDWSTFATKHFPSQLVEENSGHVANGHKTDAASKLDSFYSDEAVKLVLEIYDDDFRFFGYSQDYRIAKI